MAVSYTHLDVYKRQAKSPPVGDADRQLSAFGTASHPVKPGCDETPPKRGLLRTDLVAGTGLELRPSGYEPDELQRQGCAPAVQATRTASII